MIVQAFVDDSGSEPQAPYFVLGGFLAPFVNWLSFADEWQAELDRQPKLDYFKMNEAVALGGQFSPRRGWNEKKRDERVARFVSLIKKYASARLSAAVRREDFEQYITSIATPHRQLSTDSPYFTLFTRLLFECAEIMQHNAPNDSCRFILDEQVGYDSELILAWPEIKELASKHPRFNLTCIDAVPRFESELKFKPLQAADLCAWQIRNQYVRNNASPILASLSSIPSRDILLGEKELTESRQNLLLIQERLRKSEVPLVHAANTVKERAKQRKQGRRSLAKERALASAASDEQP